MKDIEMSELAKAFRNFILYTVSKTLDAALFSDVEKYLFQLLPIIRLVPPLNF